MRTHRRSELGRLPGFGPIETDLDARHHPGLRQREGQEDADGEQWNQGAVMPPKAT